MFMYSHYLAIPSVRLLPMLGKIRLVPVKFPIIQDCVLQGWDSEDVTVPKSLKDSRP